MKVRSRYALAAGFAVALAGSALAQDAPSADTVVATVGGSDITLGHMIALRERLPDQYRQLPDDVLFEGILDQLIQQEALSQQAEAEPPRVEFVLDNERRALMANAALQSVAETAISDEAIAAAYAEAFGDSETTTEWNAAHIIVETEEEAAEVKSDLDEGAEFADLARERSTGPSGPNGGSLGWFGPGRMIAAFEEVVSGLEPGGVSEPFQTEFGWHVVRLNDVREQEPPSLDDVRPQIAEQLQRQAIDAAINEAEAGASIERSDLSGVDPSVLSDTSLID